MNLIEINPTDQHPLYNGLICINQSWSGIAVVNGKSIEIYLTLDRKGKKFSVYKSHKSFQNFGEAKRYATKMESRYTSLKSLTALGFQRFN